MIVNAATGTVDVQTEDGLIVSLPYELLSDEDMLLQARYHAFLRHHDYRRELVCRRCKTTMAMDHQVIAEERAWEMLTRCKCRAMYGKIAWTRIKFLEQT